MFPSDPARSRWTDNRRDAELLRRAVLAQVHDAVGTDLYSMVAVGLKLLLFLYDWPDMPRADSFLGLRVLYLIADRWEAIQIRAC